MKNKFYQEVQLAETSGASKEELLMLLARGRAKRGMFEGDLDDGELEIGQIAVLIQEILPAGMIVGNIWKEFLLAKTQLALWSTGNETI